MRMNSSRPLLPPVHLSLTREHVNSSAITLYLDYGDSTRSLRPCTPET